MDRNKSGSWRCSVRIPHTRGDGPVYTYVFPTVSAYSPHAWGWTIFLIHHKFYIFVFPTRVGMDRLQPKQEAFLSCIPHTRGDGPKIQKNDRYYFQYSPHAWGWTIARGFADRWCEVFPTRVGMDRETNCCRQLGNRIPHTRGDGPPYI